MSQPPDSVRIRVAHVSTVNAPGDNRIMYKECQSLADAGYDVHYVGTDASSVVDLPDVTMHDLPRRRGRLSRMTAGPAGAVTTVRALQPDIVHLHDPELLPWVPLLKRNGTRVIYDAHEYLPSQVMGKPYLHPLVRGPVSMVARASSGGLTRLATPWCVRLPPSWRPTREPVRYRSELPQTRRWGAPTHSYPAHSGMWPSRTWVASQTAGGSGSWSRQWRSPDLKPGCASCSRGRFSPPGLQAEIEALPGWEYVDFVGQLAVQEVPALLGRARAGIVAFLPLPNHLESYPTKMFEYMAAGLPVIASDFPCGGQSSNWRAADCSWTRSPRRRPLRQSCDSQKTQIRRRPWGSQGMMEVNRATNWKSEASRLMALYEDLMAE